MGDGEHIQAGATNLVLWLGYEVCPILIYWEVSGQWLDPDLINPLISWWSHYMAAS